MSRSKFKKKELEARIKNLKQQLSNINSGFYSAESSSQYDPHREHLYPLLSDTDNSDLESNSSASSTSSAQSTRLKRVKKSIFNMQSKLSEFINNQKSDKQLTPPPHYNTQSSTQNTTVPTQSLGQNSTHDSPTLTHHTITPLQH